MVAICQSEFTDIQTRFLRKQGSTSYSAPVAFFYAKHQAFRTTRVWLTTSTRHTRNQSEIQDMVDKEAPVASARNADKFVVRLPTGMRQRVSDAAKSNHRSMNSEIVTRLERSLDGVPAPDSEFVSTEFTLGASNGSAIRLSDQEVRLVNMFRRLPDAKRMATLELLT